MKHHHLFAAAVGFIAGALLLAPSVHAAPLNTMALEFHSTTINAKGTNIPACRVVSAHGELIIPAECADVAAEIKRQSCPRTPDIDDHSCGLTVFDFTIDGAREGVM